jgi:L-lysine 2,3-aminomutase
MRVDDELCAMLRRYHPLFINTHFNHPKELTPLARAACERLADAGIPLGNQTVLLRGVNSSVTSLRALMRGLLRIKVRPYYIFHCDPVIGAGHFRTSVCQSTSIHFPMHPARNGESHENVRDGADRSPYRPGRVRPRRSEVGAQRRR